MKIKRAKNLSKFLDQALADGQKEIELLEKSMPLHIPLSKRPSFRIVSIYARYQSGGEMKEAFVRRERVGISLGSSLDRILAEIRSNIEYYGFKIKSIEQHDRQRFLSGHYSWHKRDFY